LQDFLRSMYRYLGVSSRKVEKVFGAVVVEKRRKGKLGNLLSRCETKFESKKDDILFWILHKLEYSCLRDWLNDYQFRREFKIKNDEYLTARVKYLGLVLRDGYKVVFYPSGIEIKNKEKEIMIPAPYSGMEVYVNIHKSEVWVSFDTCKECLPLFYSIERFLAENKL